MSVSQCLQFWNKYPSKDPVSRWHVLGWPWIRTPAVCPTAHSRPSGRRIPTTIVQISSSRCRSLCRCVPPPLLSTDEKMTHLCWAREHISWIRQQWILSLFTDESRFTLEKDSEHMLVFCWSRRNNTPNINPTLFKKMDTEVLESWLEQVFFLMVILTCMCSMEKLGLVREIGVRFFIHMSTHVLVLLVTIAFWCIIMYDLTNLWLFEYCLERHNLEQIEWMASSFSRPESVWKYLGLSWPISSCCKSSKGFRWAGNKGFSYSMSGPRFSFWCL